MQLLLGALDEDGAVREGEAHAPNLGITECLPAVSLVSDDFHRLQCRVQPLTKCVVRGKTEIDFILLPLMCPVR